MFPNGKKAAPLCPQASPALPDHQALSCPAPDVLTCVVETEEEEEAGMVLAKGDRLSCGRDDVPWCASRLEERGVLHTARSTPPPWEMGSLLLV